MNEQYTKDITELKQQINNLGCDVRIAMSISDKRITMRNIVIVILSVLLIGSNVAWFAYEKQFEEVKETTTTTTETYTIDQDNANGSNNYIGRDGNISYGTTENNGN
jgi:hypothetical protein